MVTCNRFNNASRHVADATVFVFVLHNFTGTVTKEVEILNLFSIPLHSYERLCLNWLYWFVFSLVGFVQLLWPTTYPGLNLRADRWLPRTPRKTRMWSVLSLWHTHFCSSKFLVISDDFVWIYSSCFFSLPCIVCLSFLFRVRWMSSLNTAQTLPWQPLMALTVLPTATATMRQELTGLPLRSPPTLTHKLLSTDSLSQCKENGFKYLNFFGRTWLNLHDWSSLRSEP